MGIQFFAPRGADGKTMQIPLSMKKTVKWLPQIGDIFPDFVVDTTAGRIGFWDWAEGGWTFLFSHPAACTPVCTTEMGAIARLRSDFEALGLKAFGMTGSPVENQVEWHKDVGTIFEAPVWFPTATDYDGDLAQLFGMRHEKEHKAWPIRKSFILDPHMRVRMVTEYPVFVGRSIEETLRVVEALQMVDRGGVATPADWYPSDPAIIVDQRTETDVMREFGAFSRRLLPYLRMVIGKGS